MFPMFVSLFLFIARMNLHFAGTKNTVQYSEHIKIETLQNKNLYRKYFQ